MCDVAFVNNTAIICQNPRVTAINSCVEVDLTGQVVSDSIGTRMYSGKWYGGAYGTECDSSISLFILFNKLEIAVLLEIIPVFTFLF